MEKKIAPSNESYECYIFTLLVKITQLTVVFDL